MIPTTVERVPAHTADYVNEQIFDFVDTGVAIVRRFRSRNTNTAIRKVRLNIRKPKMLNNRRSLQLS